MNKIRHIFRLHNLGRSKVAIAQQVGIARNTVKRYLKAFLASELDYQHIRDLADKELEELFGKFPEPPLDERLKILLDRLPLIDKELKRAGATRLSLWEAYRNDHPQGFGFTAPAARPVLSSLQAVESTGQSCDASGSQSGR